MSKQRLSKLQKEILLGIAEFYFKRREYEKKHNRGHKHFNELYYNYVSKLCRQILHLKTRTQIQSVHRSLKNLIKKGYFEPIGNKWFSIADFIETPWWDKRGISFSEKAIPIVNDLYYNRYREYIFIKNKSRKKKGKIKFGYIINKNVKNP